MLIGIVVVSVLPVVCTAVPSNGFDVLYVCPYKLGAFVWYYSVVFVVYPLACTHSQGIVTQSTISYEEACSTSWSFLDLL